MDIKNWKGTACVIGVDFGDSGKGRMIDELSPQAQVVARYSGGSNTGHTVENEFGKFAMHIMPSGIFNPKAACLVGRGVAVNLESLVIEMESLKKASLTFENLIIDEQAHLTMPWHVLRDEIREKYRRSKIGTTGNGVGPTYADRTERVGLRVKDLKSKDLKGKIYWEASVENKYYHLKIFPEEIYTRYKKLAEIVKPYIGQTIPILKKAKGEDKNILFEGAQGYFLDLDSGTYPFVTSSNPGVVGIWRSYDLHPSEIDHVFGITKAYSTRVGEGPLPTKLKGDTAKFIIEKGHEYGTTTGRVRKPGWLDLVLVKAACQSNKVTGLAVTKLDILSGLKKVKICVGYKRNGQDAAYVSHDADYLSECEPIYEELPGWDEDVTEVRNFNDLPANAKIYIKQIEDYTQVPVNFISVGPKRGEVIYV